MFNGMRIRKLRENMNISLTDMAKRISVSKQTLYKYEQGIVTNIPSDKIEAISKILNCSPAYIMGWNNSFEDMPKFEPAHDDLIHLYSLLSENEKADFMEIVSKYILLDTEKKNAVLTVVRSLSL